MLSFHGPIEQPNMCKKKNPLHHPVITPTDPKPAAINPSLFNSINLKDFFICS